MDVAASIFDGTSLCERGFGYYGRAYAIGNMAESFGTA